MAPDTHLPEPLQMRRRTWIQQYAVAIFCVLTVALTSAVLLLPLPVMVGPMLVVFLPTLIAAALIAVTDGARHIRATIFSASAWRIGLKWLVISLSLAVVLRVGVSLFSLALGYPFQPQGFTPFLIVTFLLAAGEEIGWRGYALPRLLRRFSPLAAAVILGVPWALLHAPLTLPGKMLAGVPVLPLLLTMLSLSIITTWVYLGAGKTILAPVLLHGGQNVLVFLNNGVPVEAVNWAMAAVFCLAAVILIVVTGKKLGEQTAVDQVAARAV